MQEYASATCLFSVLQILPSKICICNLLFLYLADTPLQKSASANYFFSVLQILPTQNMHPQLAFSLLADTPLQKYASTTCFFSILQILPYKNLHPQLAFSLSCRYFLLQHTLLLNYSGFLLDFYFDFLSEFQFLLDNRLF